MWERRTHKAAESDSGSETGEEHENDGSNALEVEGVAEVRPVERQPAEKIFLQTPEQGPASTQHRRLTVSQSDQRQPPH